MGFNFEGKDKGEMGIWEYGIEARFLSVDFRLQILDLAPDAG